MKPFLLLLIFLLPAAAVAQQLTGIVLDAQTNAPVKDALVSQGISASRTDSRGVFHLALSVVVDSITVYAIGYQHRRLRAQSLHFADTLPVYLYPLQSSLREFVVKGRNYRKDSLALRDEFAKQFNYRGPRISDVLWQYKSPYDAPSVSIGLTTLASMIGKKWTKDYKLQQKMLAYEKERYIDNRFTEEMVEHVTRLQGDSLARFMREYRPSQHFLQTCTDYDLLLYIKHNCEKFRGLTAPASDTTQAS